MRTIIAALIVLSASSAFGQVNTWNCNRIGDVVTCQGWQNGKLVTCTTYFMGGQSSTQCY